MDNISLLIFLFFAAGGFALSFVVNIVLLRFAKNLGMRSQEEFLVRWSSVSKPSLGGISFFITFLISLLGYAIAFGAVDVFQNKPLLGLLLGSCLAFIMGLADDAYNTRPLLKLAIQILVGITFVLSDTSVELFENVWLDGVLTILWVVGIMNSINMLDNMDGISTVTTIFILGSCLFSFLFFGEGEIVFGGLLIGLIATFMAFLFFNWNPSKMFMGDSGSQFIGAVIAFFGIQFLWNAPLELESSWYNVILAIVAFTPTLSDTLIVSINRISQGRSPMIGGRDHSTHSLSRMGLSDKKVGVVFLMLGMLATMFSSIICIWNSSSLVIVLTSCFFFICFTILFVITRKYNEKS